MARFIFLMLLFATAPSHAIGQDSEARDRVEALTAALNAPAVTDGNRFLEGEIRGRVYLLEQSGYLGEGGWLAAEEAISFTLDRSASRLLASVQTTLPAVGDMPYGGGTVLAEPRGVVIPRGETWSPGVSFHRLMIDQIGQLFPSLLLEQARAAEDLSLTADGDLRFTREGRQVTLNISEAGPFLTGFEITGVDPQQLLLAVWPEIHLEGRYGAWWETETGELMPRQVEVSLNGLPWSRMELRRADLTGAPVLEIPTLEDDAFGADPTPAFDEFPFSRRAEDVAPGVRTYYGAWHVTVVAQDEGLLILDAPISNGYSRAVIEALETDFPGQPIAGVVTTSSAWPHMAGLGAYAELGVPIYASPQARALMEAALGERSEGVTYIGEQQAVSSGPRAVQLVRSKGPATRDMIHARLPGGLLYASDAIQLQRDGAVFPHARRYTAEFLEAICRLDVDREDLVLAMHINPTPLHLVADSVHEPSRFGCDL